MCHVPKYCSMIEPHRTMQHIWFVYTVHQTLPFCCRGGSGLQDYGGTSLLKTKILVLSCEVSLASFPGPAQLSVTSSMVEIWAGPGNEAKVSLLQGEINLCWDSVKCADYLSVLISGVSFKRGSTECLLGGHNICKRVSPHSVWQSELVSAKFSS